MPTVLAVDTSAKSVSCAIVRNHKVLASFYADNGLTHSQTLMPMIENTLSVSGISVGDLDAVAVNAGPGSFTGVRIGVSAVKGIAFTANLPCVSVSTLEGMAYNGAFTPNTIVCGVMDARCQQVYSATFRIDENGHPIRMTEDAALSIADLGLYLSELGQPIVLVGDGSELCHRYLSDSVPNLTLAPATMRNQNAAATALIAERMFEAGETVSAEALLPVYLRLPQAERELNEKLKAQ